MRNGIIVAVAAGLILSIVLQPFRDFFLTVIAWLWSGIAWAYKALISSYAIPGLVLLILGLLAATSIYILFRLKKRPAYHEYTEDLMYGARWRWRWAGDSITHLWCYCPECDAELVEDVVSDFYSGATGTDFICENCGRKVITSTLVSTDLISAVNRQILRRVRTGEYSVSNKHN